MKLRKLLMSVAVCSGCVAPADKFDEFLDRKRAQLADAGGGQLEGGSDAPLEPEQIEGTYFYVVSTVLNPGQPVVYLLEVEAEKVEGSDELDLQLRERPLACADRKTPVAEFGEPRTSRVTSTGAYTSETFQSVVPAEANAPLGCGMAMATSSTVSFSGTIVNPATPDDPLAKVEFWCGTMTGSALGGIIQLEGSTFTATRITHPEDLPPVVINCAKDPAEPIPQ